MRVIYSDTMTGETEYVDLPVDTPLEPEPFRQAMFLHFRSFEMIPMPLESKAWVPAGSSVAFILEWAYSPPDQVYLIHGVIHTRYDPRWIPTLSGAHRQGFGNPPCSVPVAVEAIRAVAATLTICSEPYRASADRLGWGYMDGSPWWSEVMDTIG